MRDEFPDVLAARYASTRMKRIWGLRRKAELLRKIWISILKLQKKYGVHVPDGAVEAYEAAKDNINLDRIDELDLKLRHDVMANVRAFNEVVGFECIHEGLTSRDETDNVEQMQILESLMVVREKVIAILYRLKAQMIQHSALNIAGRSHLAVGQTTTHGKRLATVACELLFWFWKLDAFIKSYPLRGIKGAMGTQQDMLDMLKGSPDPAEALRRMEQEFRTELGFSEVLVSTGQVYPRSLDLGAINLLTELASPCANFAIMVRLMAGFGLAQEGRKKNQKGSSAMPHKKNARTCERITGFKKVLSGYQTMMKEVAGDTWFEGDVSCSVVRRVVFPDAFFAFDGLCEAMLTVLDEMQVFPALIEKELRFYQPFLSTTKVLMAAVRMGRGRETSYDVIQQRAMEAAADVEGGGENTLTSRLKVASVSLGLSEAELDEAMLPDHGNAEVHVKDTVSMIDIALTVHPRGKDYNPEPLR